VIATESLKFQKRALRAGHRSIYGERERQTPRPGMSSRVSAPGRTVSAETRQPDPAFVQPGKTLRRVRAVNEIPRVRLHHLPRFVQRAF
jgi:hypothetical protein